MDNLNANVGVNSNPNANVNAINIISVEQNKDPIRRKNFYLNVFGSNLIWLIFHYSVYHFFWIELHSLALVGFFLGLGNFFSVILDISIGIIQKYFKPKTLFVTAYMAQIFAMFIFIFLTIEAVATENLDELGFLGVLTEFFLNHIINIILLVVASFCYGLAKELQEVTIYSYILNHNDHDEYAKEIARKNIAAGVGAMIGLVLSGFVLKLSSMLIILLTVIMIILAIIFTIFFFDNDQKTLNFRDIYKFKVTHDPNKDNLEDNSKNTQTINKMQLKQVVTEGAYIFLKPQTLQTGISFRYLYEETIRQLKAIYKIITNKNNSKITVWSIIVMLAFGFWDTFATTFLISYLDGFSGNNGYFMLLLIAIPGYGLQDFFSKLSKKYGVYTISNIGLLVSGLSLMTLGIFTLFSEEGFSTMTIFILILAITNSIGYAACTTLSQAGFMETYNIAYSRENNLSEIDANSSAAPLRLLLNTASMLGLFLGGTFLQIFHGYVGFFIAFSIVIMLILYWSVKNQINN